MDAGLLISLQQKAARTRDEAELSFLMANETWNVVAYRQAFVFFQSKLGKMELAAVTGLVTIEENTPFALWLNKLAKWANKQFTSSLPTEFAGKEVPESLAEEWQEWWPEHALFVPLTQLGGKHAGQRIGYVIYVRDDVWQDSERKTLDLLHQAYSSALLILRWKPVHVSRPHLRRSAIVFGVLLLMVCAIPIRISALAPAEIIALSSEMVTAPMEGVVDEFYVAPNTKVQKGQPLFKLDDTVLKNRRAIALEALSTAKADVLTAQQKAFNQVESKAALAVLQGRKREKESELLYLEEQLQHTVITANNSGVFIYSDPNDWNGRPVVTGERVGQLAQPDALGVQVWLPIHDAINLDLGAAMQVYLQVKPLQPLGAVLTQTSYQASISPEGVAAYVIRGRLTQSESYARIGLRGVSKIYGDKMPLIYFVLRRPLGTVRQMLGL